MIEANEPQTETLEEAWERLSYCEADLAVSTKDTMEVARAFGLACIAEVPVSPEHPHDKQLREALGRLRRRVSELGRSEVP